MKQARPALTVELVATILLASGGCGHQPTAGDAGPGSTTLGELTDIQANVDFQFATDYDGGITVAGANVSMKWAAKDASECVLRNPVTVTADGITLPLIEQSIPLYATVGGDETPRETIFTGCQFPAWAGKLHDLLATGVRDGGGDEVLIADTTRSIRLAGPSWFVPRTFEVTEPAPGELHPGSPGAFAWSVADDALHPPQLALLQPASGLGVSFHPRARVDGGTATFEVPDNTLFTPPVFLQVVGQADMKVYACDGASTCSATLNVDEIYKQVNVVRQ